MDGSYVALISIAATALLLLVQRTEPRRRRLALIISAFCLLVIRHNAFLRGDLHEETALAFGVGLLFSGLFWLLIGRYNPVAADEAIRVIGMDD